MKTGKIYRGEPENGIKADTTLTIDDSDMIDLVSISNIILFICIHNIYEKLYSGSWKAKSSNGIYERQIENQRKHHVSSKIKSIKY